MGNSEKEVQERNLDILVRNDGFQFINTFFPYTSGQIGPYFIQSGDAMKNGPDYVTAVTDMSNLVLANASGRIDVISGGETRDWIFSNPVGIMIYKPTVMLYKDGKTVGASMKGKNVVHVADLNNEGSSPRDYWFPIIKIQGGNIRDIFFYVDRMEDGVEEMKKLGLNSYSAVPLNENAWAYLKKKGVINKEIYNSLARRLEDKNSWATSMLRSEKGIERLITLLGDKKTHEKAVKVVNSHPHIKDELVEKVFRKSGVDLFTPN